MPLLRLSLGIYMIAGPACAQTLGQAGEPQIAWWRLAGALLLCLGLGIAGAFVLRARVGAGGPTSLPWRFASTPSKRLRVIERVLVSPQADVCLIGCDGAEYLIAVSSQNVQLIAPHSSIES